MSFEGGLGPSAPVTTKRRAMTIRVDRRLILLSFAAVGAIFMRGGETSTILAALMLLGILHVSVLLHELAHAVAARRLGYPVREVVLTPWGGSANLEAESLHAGDEWRIAWAGPAMNLLLATHALLARMWLGLSTGAEAVAELMDVATMRAGLSNVDFLLATALINLALGGLNLLPLFPLDGGRVCRAVLASYRGRAFANRSMVTIARIVTHAALLSAFLTQDPTWIIVLAAAFWSLVISRREAARSELDSWLERCSVALGEVSGQTR